MDTPDPLPLPPASPAARPGAARAGVGAGLAMGGDGHELRKPHEMIVLVPRSKRVTLTGRRIYNALLHVAQSRLAAMAQMPPADFLFEAPLPAILRTTGSSGEDRTAAKRYLREMRGLEVDWESTAPGDGVKWKGFSMLSEVVIELRNGENWVSWSYPPTLMVALKEPTRWARIDLDMLTRLGTYAALALYEICARYRDNPSGLTSRKPVQWWADALSPTPAGSERREWRKFKNERVKDAIEEINRETDLEIELVEHRQGRAVVEAQFAVRRRRVVAAPRGDQSDPVDANLVLRAESLGVRESKLDGLIAEFGEAAVREQVTVLERRASDNRLRGIENGYSYLRALLRNGEAEPAPAVPGVPPSGARSMDQTLDAATAGGGAAGAWSAAPAPAARSPSGPVPMAAASAAFPARAQAVPATEPTTGPTTGPAVPPASDAPAAALSTASATALPQEPAQHRWLAERMAALRVELAALDPVHRRPWVDAALAELSAKGLLSAVIARRAAQGDVLHGMLGAVLLRLYADAVHGPGWDQPPL